MLIYALEKYSFLGECIFCHRHYVGVVCDFCADSFYVRDEHKNAMCKVCGVRLTSEQNLCVTCKNLETEDKVDSICYIFSLWAYNIYTLKLIQNYKKDGNKVLGFYLAKQYYAFLLQVLERKHIKKEDVIIITMPANPQHVRKTGFDHMKLVSTYMFLFDAALPIFHAIVRRKSKEQKTLNAEQRRINIKNTLFLKRREKKKIISVYAKNPHIHVVLLDDVVTTGATIHTAYQLIRAELPSIPTNRIFAVGLVRNEY